MTTASIPRRQPAQPMGRLSGLISVLIVLLISHGNNNLVHVRAADDLTMHQVFDAIDTNHDHSISESEYLNAVNKLAGLGGDASAGGGSAAAGISPGAPSLGGDSRPALSSGINLKDKLKFDNPSSGKDFFKGLFASFSAIIATEIGDKTFFIAAVLSMRNDRLAVFGGAILALIIMTILSTFMGLVLPALIPKKYTHIIGGILFLYFGFKLLIDSRGMEDKVSEELEEVEEELAEMNKKKKAARKKKQVEEVVTDDDDVEGQPIENGDENGAKKRRGGGGKTLKHAASSSLSAAGDYSGSSWEAVFLQALTMTFLAEWGDRSQIATIALAAAKVSERDKMI